MIGWVSAGAWGRWTVRHRLGIALVAAVWTAVAGAGGRYLALEGRISIFFEENDPQRLQVVAYQAALAQQEYVFLLLAPRDGDLFTPAALAALKELTLDATALPRAQHVYSLFNHPQLTNDEDDLFVAPLIPLQPDLDDNGWEDLRATVRHNALLQHRLLSPDLSTAAVIVRLDVPLDADRERADVAARVNELVRDWSSRHPDMTLTAAGDLLFEATFVEAGQRDLRVLSPFMLVAVLLLLALIFRSAATVAAVWLVVAGATVAALGLAGWFGFTLSVISVIAPGLVATLTVADSVHIVRATLAQRRLGRAPAIAVERAMQENLQPVLMTSATTAMGFLVLNLLDSPPYRDLGNMVALGVVTGFFYSSLLLPALLSLWPGAVHDDPLAGFQQRIRRLGRYIEGHRGVRTGGMITMGVILVVGMARLEWHANAQQNFSPRMAVRQAVDRHVDRMGGYATWSHAISAAEPDGIASPDYVRHVDALAEWFRRQPQVLHVQSIADPVRLLAKAWPADQLADDGLPVTREVLAQILLMYELSLPPGPPLDGRADAARSLTSLDILTAPMSVREWLAFEAAGLDQLHHRLPSPYHVVASAGQDLMWAAMADRNVRRLFQSALSALLLIAVITGLVYRHPAWAIIMFGVNILPLALALGLWGLFSPQAGLVVAVMMPVMVGLVVDDTIHILARFVRLRRRDGWSREAAARGAVEEVDLALIISSGVLIGGCAVLLLSPFTVTTVVGRMAMLVTALALLIDLWLLPVWLARYAPRAERSSGLAKTGALLAVALLLGGGTTWATPVVDPVERGRELDAGLRHSLQGFNTLSAALIMHLEGARGAAGRREMQSWTREQAGGRLETLCVVWAPPDVRGTALLSHIDAGTGDQQWLYLPTARRVRRLAGGHRVGSFMGSEFTYEDIAGGLLPGTEPVWAGEEYVDGYRCDVLRYTIPGEAESGYARQDVWVDHAAGYIRRIDYHDRRDQLVKTLTLRGHERFNEQFWHATEMIMEHHRTRNRTRLLWSDIVFGAALDPEIFDPRHLDARR